MPITMVNGLAMPDRAAERANTANTIQSIADSISKVIDKTKAAAIIRKNRKDLDAYKVNVLNEIKQIQPDIDQKQFEAIKLDIDRIQDYSELEDKYKEYYLQNEFLKKSDIKIPLRWGYKANSVAVLIEQARAAEQKAKTKAYFDEKNKSQQPVPQPAQQTPTEPAVPTTGLAGQQTALPTQPETGAVSEMGKMWEQTQQPQVTTPESQPSQQPAQQETQPAGALAGSQRTRMLEGDIDADAYRTAKKFFKEGNFPKEVQDDIQRETTITKSQKEEEYNKKAIEVFKANPNMTKSEFYASLPTDMPITKMAQDIASGLQTEQQIATNKMRQTANDNMAKYHNAMAKVAGIKANITRYGSGVMSEKERIALRKDKLKIEQQMFDASQELRNLDKLLKAREIDEANYSILVQNQTSILNDLTMLKADADAYLLGKDPVKDRDIKNHIPGINFGQTGTNQVTTNGGYTSPKTGRQYNLD